MSMQQLFLVQSEQIREHVPEPDTFAVSCVNCKREMLWDRDTDTWTFADDLDYYPIPEPETTKLGIYCQGCWEDEDEAVVLALLEGIA